MEDKKISVIIPIYNMEEKLSKCIDSILNQDYLHEIILINDGSQDSSEIICKKYQKRYPQIIKYKAINNHGASYARNIGLNMATGKYINFVDSDDTLPIGAYKDILDKNNDYDYDIIFWGLTKIFSDGGATTYTPPCTKCKKEADLNSAIFKLKLNEQHFAFFGFSTNKLYKRSILEKYNIRFQPNIDIAEDELFCSDYCSHIQSLSIIPNSYYNYNIYSSSLTRKKKDISTYIHLSNSLFKNANTIKGEEHYKYEFIRAYAFAFRGYIENPIKTILFNHELKRILLKAPMIKAKRELFQYKSKYVQKILSTNNKIMRFIYLITAHILLNKK